MRYPNTLRFLSSPLIGTADAVFGRRSRYTSTMWLVPDANGLLDVLKIQPLTGIGYYDYAFVENKPSMVIPGE